MSYLLYYKIMCKARFNTSTLYYNAISGFGLDKKFQWNASKFAIFYMYENPKFAISVWMPWSMSIVDIDQDIHKGKTQSYSKWKTKQKISGFSFSINMANFEAFHWVFLSPTNCLFLNCVNTPKCLYICTYLLTYMY